MYNKLDDFIKYGIETKEAFTNYRKYPKDVQKMMCNIYSCCFRFGFYKKQTIFILNKAIESFSVNDEKEMLGL